MFGGHGIYAGEMFFGILFDGRLFFKVSEHTKADYEARGTGPFTYELPDRMITMSYYEVPADVLEERGRLLEWARKAVTVAAANAESSKSPKPSKTSRPRRK